MKTVILYRGTNQVEMKELLKKGFKDISWWTTNFSNLSHYCDGACAKLILEVDEAQRKEYINNYDQLTKDYTFGSAEMNEPVDSEWYSISRSYLCEHCTSIEEILDWDFSDEEDEDEDNFEMFHNGVKINTKEMKSF